MKLVVVSRVIRQQTVVVFATVLFPFVAAAQTVVMGRNDQEVDVAAVQAAVDQGGNVLLVDTFNFGDSGRVLIRNDVDISGEVDGSGNLPKTRILGGDWPFYSPLPAGTPTKPGPKIGVEKIHFHGAKGVAIHLAYTGGATIRQNRVTGMRGRLFNDKHYRRSAVMIGPLDSRPRANIDITPNLVSGPINVEGNYFNSEGAEPSNLTNAGAVFMAFINGADMRIENNRSIGCTRNCIVVLDAIADTSPDPARNGQGSLVIAGNAVVSNVLVGFTGPGPRAPVGIDASMFFNRGLASPDVQHIPLLIANNYVELNGETSVGIVSAFNGGVVEGNRVVVHASSKEEKVALLSGGITVAASRNVVRHNTIAGEATSAIRIAGNDLNLPRTDNVAIANHISGFKAFGSDYLLEVAATSNTIVGNSGTVNDKGANNAITGGLQPVEGGVGDAVSSVQRPELAD